MKRRPRKKEPPKVEKEKVSKQQTAKAQEKVVQKEVAGIAGETIMLKIAQKVKEQGETLYLHIIWEPVQMRIGPQVQERQCGR